MQLNGHEIIVILEALAASGVAVSILAKLLKKVARGHLDEDIHKVVLVLSAVAGYAQYADQLHAVLPPYILGISATSIYGISQLVYKSAKSTTAFLGQVQNSADNKPAAAVPVEAPVTPVEPTAGTEATF